jgi:hypothetical protein
MHQKQEMIHNYIQIGEELLGTGEDFGVDVTQIFGIKYSVE